MSSTKRKQNTSDNKLKDNQNMPDEINLVYGASLEAHEYLIPVPKNYKLTATLIKIEPKDDFMAHFDREKYQNERWQSQTLFRENETLSTYIPTENITGNFGQGAEYDILKLQRMLFEHKTQVNLLLGEKGALQQENQLLTELVSGKESDIMDNKVKRLSQIPFAVFSVILLSVFIFALTTHIIWRFTGEIFIAPETSYLLTLGSLGLLATSLTGLFYRGKHGVEETN